MESGLELGPRGKAEARGGSWKVALIHCSRLELGPRSKAEARGGS